jgi:iron complex outermembrane recepter protein
MNELMNKSYRHAIRWKLLSTVSALALFGAVYGTGESRAADQDADRPTLWIELGGQLEHANGQGEPFAPAFLAAYPNSPVLQSPTPLQAQNPRPFSFAEEGRISFQPEDSNWVFSAAVNYGRSSNFKHVHNQTSAVHYPKYKYGAPLPNPNTTGIITAERFADTQAHHRESHAILDFSAGKDFGLGLFGRESSSVLNFGVRFAQFASDTKFTIRARPDLQIQHHTFPAYHLTLNSIYFHTYYATGQASRSFRGLGPSLSWNGSAPFLGNPKNGEITFDWGANAAILFGKQKARAQHQESAHYRPPGGVLGNYDYQSVYQHPPKGHSGVRSITVPNVGGFAGASFRMENVKVSLGYRADFFFGAIDGGIDTPKRTTTGFYGPFANVSIGIGG